MDFCSVVVVFVILAAFCVRECSLVACLLVVEEEEDTQTAIELEQQQHIPSNVI